MGVLEFSLVVACGATKFLHFMLFFLLVDSGCINNSVGEHDEDHRLLVAEKKNL